MRYPTDLSLLNEARQHTEQVIDLLYAQVRGQVSPKPRTYRHQARHQYLQVAKQPPVKYKTLPKAVGQPLRYVRRNLADLDALIKAGASLAQRDKHLDRK
jgi:hypothetical protein